MQTKITLQCIYNTNSVCFTDDEERLSMRSSRLYNFVNLGIALAKAYCNHKHSQIQHMITAYMYFSVLSKIYIMLKKKNQSTGIRNITNRRIVLEQLEVLHLIIFLWFVPI